MRKRFIAFLLATIIVFLDIGSVFANTITVLDPVMAEKNNVETTEEVEDSPIRVLSPRDSNNKIIKNESNSPSILQNPLELGARDNGEGDRNKQTKENKDDKKSTNSVVELGARKVPEKAQGKKIKKDSKPLQKNTLNTSPFSFEKREDFGEGLEEEIEVSEPITGEAVAGAGAARPAGGWETYEIGNGWTLGDFRYVNNEVIGFSDSGFKKVETNKDLILPSVVPNNSIKEFDKLRPVTAIGYIAFKDNNLTSVVIPDSVTTIASYAFSGNQLTSVVIGNGVKTIRASAFQYNQIRDIVIPEGVTTIEESVFASNQLTSVVIPEGVTTIGKDAFNSNQLTSVAIPESVTTMGNGAFSFNQLTSVILPKNITNIEARVFENNKLTSIVLPKNLTNIGAWAFHRNLLSSIVFPDSLTSIGFSAFTDNQLTSIVFSKNLTSIESWAFRNNQLTSVIIPGSLTNIEYNAFAENPGLNDKHQVFLYTESGTNPNNLPDSYCYLVDPKEPKDNTLFTFEGDILTGLSEKGIGLLKGNSKTIFTIPYKTPSGENVREIKESAFEGLGANFVFPIDPNKIEKIGDHAFFKNKVAELDFSNFRNLTEVDPYAFAHNEVKTLTVPESLKTVGNYAFRDNLIKEIDTKNIETIGEGAFSNNRIEKLTFGDALTAIGSHAFEQNDLVKVNISNNVTNFGTSVFAFNNRYVKIETENPIVKTEKVYRGFGHVVNPVIIKVKYVDKDTKEEILDSKTMGEDLTVEGGVFILGEENIFYPEKIKGYWIQEEVKFTPDKDNYELTLEYIYLRTKPIIEVMGLRMIKKGEVVDKTALLSFIKATDLTGKDITSKVSVFPETLDTSVGGFKKVTYSVTDEYGNTEVKDVNLPVETDWFKYPIGKGWVLGDFTYEGSTVTGFTPQGEEKVKTNKDLIIPSVVPEDGVEIFDKLTPVNTIGKNSFSSKGLTNIEIPTSITTIGDNSFSYNAMKNLVIPDSVTVIGNGAFSSSGYNDVKLEKVRLPKNLISIGDSAFSSNKLTSVVIPDNVSFVGSDAFASNKINNLVIGKNTKTISDYAFSDNLIPELDIPNSVTTIGNSAFRQNNLTNIEIPDSVTSIGDYAFFQNKLVDVYVGDGVKTIGVSAFQGVEEKSGLVYNNNSIKTVRLGKSLETIMGDAFKGNAIEKLIIPDGTKVVGSGAFAENQINSVTIPNSVTTIGAEAFRSNYISEIDIPEGVTTIEDNAFSFNKLTNVVIPEGVTTIGVNAFKKNKLKKINIPDSVTVIKLNAFAENELTEVKIPDGVKQLSGFSKNKIRSITIPDSVETIESDAFSSNLIEEIKIPKGVKEIGKNAFSSNLLTHVEIPNSVETLDGFSNNQLASIVISDSVKTIKSSAFSNNKLTEVTIPNSVISLSGFSDNKLSKVEIPDSVEEINSSAFKNNVLREIVIGKSVKRIFRSAFQTNKLTEVNIPLSLQRIDSQAFWGNPGIDSKHNVALLTPDRTNPHKLKNKKDTNRKKDYAYMSVDDENPQEVRNYASGYIINPFSVRMNFVKENGEVLKKSITKSVASGDNIEIPNIFIYGPEYIKETGEKIANNSHIIKSNGSRFVDWTIVYKDLPINGDGSVVLKTRLKPSINKDSSSYFIGDEQRFNINFKILKDVPNISNAEIKILMPKSVNPSSIKIPKHPNVKDFIIDEQEVTIKFQNIGGGTTMEIPLLFKMKNLSTPENERHIIKTTIINNNSEIVCSVEENSFSGFYSSPKLDISARAVKHPETNDELCMPNYSRVPDYVILGMKELVGAGEQVKTRLKNIVDLSFNFKTTIDRNIEKYTIETKLPSYLAYDNDGNSMNLKANFDKTKNPDWDLIGDKLICKKTNLNTSSPHVPNLILSFPKIKWKGIIKLNTKISLTPKNIGKNEETKVTYSNIKVIAVDGNCSKDVLPILESTFQIFTDKPCLYDTSFTRHGYFPISVDVSGVNSLHYEKMNFNINVFNGDDRYSLHNIINTGKKPLLIKIKKTDVSQYTADFILKPNEISQELPKNINEFEVMIDTESPLKFEDLSFMFNVKLKNPDKPWDTYNSFSKNLNINIEGEQTVYFNGKNSFYRDKKALTLNPESMWTSTQATITNHQDLVNPFIPLVYYVGVESKTMGTLCRAKKNSSVASKEIRSEFEKNDREDFINFKQIAIFPKTFVIKNITLSDSFRNSVKPQYKIITLADESKAVLFTAEKLDKNTNNIATIDVIPMFEKGTESILATTYANWDNKKIKKYNEEPLPSDAYKYVKNSATYDYKENKCDNFFIEGITSEKNIINSNGSYSRLTETKEKNVDYEIKVSNLTTSDRSDFVILDILPYEGDERGSKINMFLREPVNFPQGKVFYTTEEHPTENSKYKEEFTEGVTGIKIKVDKINMGESVSAILKCVMDIPSDFSKTLLYANLSAYNDFLRKDDLTASFAKSNKTEVTFTLGNASIEFYKYGLKKSIFSNKYNKKPLSGVEFELRDVDGKYIKSAFSDSNGLVVFSDVETKDYIIKEVEAPKGFVIGEPIRVLTSDYALYDGGIIKAILKDDITNNSYRLGNLTVNAVTINGNPIAGIDFVVKSTDNTNKSFRKTITSNSSGVAILKNLPEGNYIVEELESNKFLSAPTQTFKIEQTPGDEIPETQEVNLKFVNDKVKVRLKKVEFHNNEEVPKDIFKISSFNRKAIGNVSFEIEGKEYITDYNGYIEFVIDLQKNESNAINPNNLHMFSIKETKSPLKYIKSDAYNGINFGLNDYGEIFLDGDKDKKFIYNEIVVPNKSQALSNKVLIETKDFNGNPLKDAIFSFEKIKNGIVTESKKYSSDEFGNITINNLPSGNYKLKETSAPDGFYHEKYERYITIVKDLENIDSILEEEQVTQLRNNENYDFYVSNKNGVLREIKYTVINKPINLNFLKYELILKNVDEKDIAIYDGKEGYKVIRYGKVFNVVKPLQGVEFDLYEGNTFLRKLTTKEDGSVDFGDIKFKETSSYSLKETKALEGFKLEKVPYKFNIERIIKKENFDGNINVNIENKRLTGKIIISKYNWNNNTILEGQEFTLYDNTGKEISKKVTNSAGLIEFNNLIPGTYTFKETKVNGDYMLDNKVYTANITLSNLIHVEKIFNKAGSIDVRVTKVDDQSNPLESIEFAIFKGDKMIYGPIKTNKDGITIFKNVKIEDGLVVKEISTIKGYNLNNESVKIDFNADNIEVNFTNHKAEQILPDTGTLNEAPYLTIGLILLVASIVLKKEKTNNYITSI